MILGMSNNDNGKKKIIIFISIGIIMAFFVGVFGKTLYMTFGV